MSALKSSATSASCIQPVGVHRIAKNVSIMSFGQSCPSSPRTLWRKRNSIAGSLCPCPGNLTLHLFKRGFWLSVIRYGASVRGCGRSCFPAFARCQAALVFVMNSFFRGSRSRITKFGLRQIGSTGQAFLTETANRNAILVMSVS